MTLPRRSQRKNLGRFSRPVSKLRYAVRQFMALVLLGLGVAVGIFGYQSYQVMNTQQLDLLAAVSDVARDWNLGVVVATAENIYYQYINPPQVGGTPTAVAAFDGSTRLSSGNGKVGIVLKHPKANVRIWGAATSPSMLPGTIPSPVTPTAGEGVWLPTKIVVNGETAVYVARVRPDALHTSVYATEVWFDPHLLAFRQIAGTKMPEGNFPHGNGRVPKTLRRFYVAGFASGYHMKDSQGGAILNHQVVKPLVDGKATLLTYSDGSMQIVDWGRDTFKPGFLSARQNLDLLVDHGVSQVVSEDQAKWGLVWYGTGSGKNYIWRTAIGIRADGTVVYVQGQALSARSLADLLVRAGVVTGMSLDMNKAFSNAAFYGPYGTGGRNINPDNHNPSSAFYKTTRRDFIAVFVKSPNQKPRAKTNSVVKTQK